MSGMGAESRTAKSGSSYIIIIGVLTGRGGSPLGGACIPVISVTVGITEKKIHRES